MKEERKEDLVQLLAGWVFLSPILAYIFHVDPMSFWLFIGGVCYLMMMVATNPLTTRPQEAPKS